MKRLFPIVVALCLLFVWGTYAIGAAILSAYRPDDPLAYLATPRIVIVSLAALVAVGLLIRHMAKRGLGLRRCLAEAGLLLLATFAGIQIWALAFAPAPHRLADFAGQSYALPISYGPRLTEPSPGHQELEFQVCMPALTPYYDNPLCDSRGFSLSTQPLTKGFLAEKFLTAAGAQVADGTLVAPGQLLPEADGLSFTIDTRKTVFVTDAAGRITALRSCDSEATDLCLSGLEVAGGLIALVLHPADETDAAAEAARYLDILSSWRCPDAVGCVPKP